MQKHSPHFNGFTDADLDALLPDEELFEEQRAASAPSACSAAAAAALSAAILNDPDGEAAARAAAEADATPLCLLNPVQWVQYALFLEKLVLWGRVR